MPTAERPISREEIIDQLEQLERQVSRLSPGAQGPKGDRGWKGLAAPVYSPTIVDLEEHKRSVEREWAPFNTELRRFRTTLRRLHNLHQSIETNDTRKLLVGFIHWRIFVREHCGAVAVLSVACAQQSRRYDSIPSVCVTL